MFLSNTSELNGEWLRLCFTMAICESVCLLQVRAVPRWPSAKKTYFDVICSMKFWKKCFWLRTGLKNWTGKPKKAFNNLFFFSSIPSLPILFCQKPSISHSNRAKKICSCWVGILLMQLVSCASYLLICFAVSSSNTCRWSITSSRACTGRGRTHSLCFDPVYSFVNEFLS